MIGWIRGTKSGAMVGLLALGGCTVLNPMYVEPSDSATGTTSAGTTSDARTTSDSEGSSTVTGATSSMTPTSTTMPPPGICGDGEMNPGEECDDGNLEPLDGCSELCWLPYCGDGYVEGPEQCDGNLDDNGECLNNCMLATCGDGKVFAGVEACDDGNMADDDDCVNGCKPAKCGDGVVHVGTEECDDNNDVNTDDCPASCMLPYCGDGVQWAGMEECDDGNEEDNDSCVDCKVSLPYRLVFVTSATFTGNIGGLAAADLKCQTLANDAKLQGTFLAWLGDEDQWPENRMSKAKVPYRRTDFITVAQDWPDLVDGALAAPIDRTEKGDQVMMAFGPCPMATAVHTNIANNGTLADAKNNCGDWTSVDGMTNAGQIGMKPTLWTTGCMIPCATPAPIYCVQQ